MRRKGDPAFGWLAAAVLAHLIVSIVHGAAHAGAHVLLSTPATLYVLVVILAGSLIGLALLRSGRAARSWVIAVTLVGSFVFGLVYHFVFSNPDNVGHVDSHLRALFATTAVLLALTEALGGGLAISFVRRRKSYEGLGCWKITHHGLPCARHSPRANKSPL